MGMDQHSKEDNIRLLWFEINILYSQHLELREVSHHIYSYQEQYSHPERQCILFGI